MNLPLCSGDYIIKELQQNGIILLQLLLSFIQPYLFS